VDKLEFKKKDASRPAYGERKPYENRGNSSYGERKPYGNRDERPAYGERKPYEKREDRPAYGDKPRENRPRFNAQSGEKTFRKPFNSSDDRPQGEKLAFKKPGENSPTEYVETRFDNKRMALHSVNHSVKGMTVMIQMPNIVRKNKLNSAKTMSILLNLFV